jgi:signal transduction histidine kinase
LDCGRQWKRNRCTRRSSASTWLPGIPEDEQSRIFDKFYRVGQKETESISGTGLGLTVVKEIVEAHKGKIIVDSKPGKGSKFSVILNYKNPMA